MSDIALTTPKETAKAAQAFADYVELGPGRSLAKLANSYGRPESYVGQLYRWSRDHQWQERIKALAAEQIEQAQDYRTSTYVNITKEYHRRISDEPRRQIMELSALHGIYDRVKPEPPKGGNPGDTGGGNVLIQFVFHEVTGRD